jgi:hypothetical protein
MKRKEAKEKLYEFTSVGEVCSKPSLALTRKPVNASRP